MEQKLRLKFPDRMRPINARDIGLEVPPTYRQIVSLGATIETDEWLFVSTVFSDVLELHYGDFRRAATAVGDRYRFGNYLHTLQELLDWPAVPFADLSQPVPDWPNIDEENLSEYYPESEVDSYEP